MSTLIGIMGHSGSGKSTSCMKLDPKTTYWIDADRKGLSWLGWQNDYNEANQNYYKNSDPDAILRRLGTISETRPEIKTIIVDTLNSIMVDAEIERMKEKGYDKWAELACDVWKIIGQASQLRDDIVVITTHHIDDTGTDGAQFFEMKTSGRKIKKLLPESKYPIVLLSRCNAGKYTLDTHALGSTAKTPYGMFKETTIPNDITIVLNKLAAVNTKAPAAAPVAAQSAEKPITVTTAPVVPAPIKRARKVENQAVVDELIKAMPGAREMPKRSKEQATLDIAEIKTLADFAGLTDQHIDNYMASRGWIVSGAQWETADDKYLAGLAIPVNWDKAKEKMRNPVSLIT